MSYPRILAKDTNYEPLDDGDQKWIAAQIHQLLPTLRTRHRAWAYKLIDDMLWFWTADAVLHGTIKRDAIKTDHRHLHHTQAALESLREGLATPDDKVQHEHAGERVEIIGVLEKAEDPSVGDVLAILRALNVAVLVTKREHLALGKRTWDADWRKRNWRTHYDGKIPVHPPAEKKMPDQLPEYHERHFLLDLGRLPTVLVPVDHMREPLRGLSFFDSLQGAKIAEAHRLPFAVCFYFESLIDQGLHHHFTEAHKKYQAVRQLPKFGTFGMGPQISPPAAFLQAARKQWNLSCEHLPRLLAEGARHFPTWVNDFFADKQVPIAASELLRALGTQDLGDLGVVTWV